jgi:hypothetical protein
MGKLSDRPIDSTTWRSVQPEIKESWPRFEDDEIEHLKHSPNDFSDTLLRRYSTEELDVEDEKDKFYIMISPRNKDELREK